MKSVLTAVAFLTRIPVPHAMFSGGSPTAAQTPSLTRATWAFPAVGVMIGLVVAGSLVLLEDRPLVGVWLAFALWVVITGGLHLDGLADVADGLGGAHRDRTRFLQVAKDPHIGGYGASAIVVQLISTVLLLLAVAPEHYWAVVLVPAWARWTAVLTPVLVPALGDGMAARMGRRHRLAAVIWALVLAAASLWLAPALLVAAAIGPLIAGFWRLKLGGFNGDCLGAGITVCETGLLLALAVT